MAVPTGLSAKQQGRRFAFTLGIALLVLGGLSRWRGHEVAPLVLVVPGALLLLGGLVAPAHLGPIERRWMAFGHLLSRLVSPVALAIIYFGVVTPFGLVMRLLGKNPLTEHHQATTTWVVRGKKRQSDLKRLY
ncbi:SxtJ family membrane protein [Mesorhizobium caraganae]|uniref:SxtJ family membrane protein n=1 Tax=Mesorhizobium caraganae TaxID=483206 RepID=UPI003ECD692C